MANAPQGNGGGSAEGGHVSALPKWSTETFDKEGIEDPVQQPPTPNLGNTALDNRVQSIDVTKIANDEPNDSDYDDPYPGGDTPSLGLPLDG